MEKHRKSTRIGYWCVTIVSSLLVGFVLGALDLDPDAERACISIWTILVAAGALAINLLWARSFGRQVDALRALLFPDPDRYIAEITALLEGKKSPQLRGTLLVNLGAAYCQKGDYQKAKEYFLQVVPKKLAPINRPVYWADLAMAHFYLGEDAAALTILEAQKASFDKLRDDSSLGELLAILSIFELLAKGNRSKARELLEATRPRWESERSAPDFAYLARRCGDETY